MNLKTVIVHPFFIALVPSVYLLSHNISEVTGKYIEDFLWVFLSSLALAGLFWGVFCLFIKDKLLAALLASFLLIVFFFGGDIYTSLSGGIKLFFIKFTLKGPVKYGLFLLFAAAVYSVFVFKLKTAEKLKLNQFLNIISVFMLISSSVSIGGHLLNGLGNTSHASSSASLRETSGNPQNHKELPDVYYFILDAYASPRLLKSSLFDYQDDSFFKSLESKGFYVAYDSHSNYSQTGLSIPSTLNLEFINFIEAQSKDSGQKIKALFALFYENKVMKEFKKQGYKIINFSSGWSLTNNVELADQNIACGVLDEYTNIFFQKTILSLYLDQLKTAKYDRTLCIYNKLDQVSRQEGQRKFVFIHVVAPHGPYVFDRNGKSVQQPVNLIPDSALNRKLYLDQLIYISKLTEKAINSILANSKRRPIIIVQSDHGSETLFCKEGCWEKPTHKMLIERMSILNAYYVPEEIQKDLYQNITPVNTYRVLFNHLFDKDYPLLPDKNYYSSYSDRFHFNDVTEIINDK